MLSELGKSEKQHYRDNFTSNPVWGAKVGRLKKVKNRLKKFIR